MTYNAYITRIRNVRKHPNANRLLLGECFGNQVVVGLNTVEDELGVYFPTDGRLSIEFMKANNLLIKIDPDTGEQTGTFDEKGRIRTRKFMKEKSDGFWCPVSYLESFGEIPKEGTCFTEINGVKICGKYVTEKTINAQKKQKAVPKIKYPMFHEHIDTEQLAYNLNKIKIGQTIIFTEKLHGTSGRTSYSQAVSYSGVAKFINGFFKREIIKPIKEWKYVCGSRRVVIKDFERVSGFYKDDEIIRKQAHECFVGKLHKGETVYYEIVGYLSSGTPIMPSCNNSKLDKDFVKQYGKETVFSYGCTVGQFKVYVYRISMSNEDGVEIDYTYDQVVKRCEEMAVFVVPLIHKTTVTTLPDWVYSEAKALAKGSSIVSPSHIREGVVVRIDGSKWEAYKHKSFEFKVLEGIIKDTGVEDIEEAS